MRMHGVLPRLSCGPAHARVRRAERAGAKSLDGPDHVAEWFGPAGLDSPRVSVEIDLRVGGRFNLRMVQPGTGREYPLHYEIVEPVEPELLVLASRPMAELGLQHGTVARIELEEDGGKTRMTLTDGPYPEAGARGAGQGWEGRLRQAQVLLAPSTSVEASARRCSRYAYAGPRVIARLQSVGSPAARSRWPVPDLPAWRSTS